jgi:hypothetical protein
VDLRGSKALTSLEFIEALISLLPIPVTLLHSFQSFSKSLGDDETPSMRKYRLTAVFSLLLSYLVSP